MTIAESIYRLQQLIASTTRECQRPTDSVQLLAVSKGQSAQAIEEAYAAGLRHFGENYLQEALLKMDTLSSLPICWHFIGPIQSNKTKGIAQGFSWVHSVSSEKIAHFLNKHRPEHQGPLNICLQVNLDREDSKAGVYSNDLAALAVSINELPQLTLRGLMAIPQPQQDEQQQYRSFLRLNDLLLHLNKEFNLSMDTLSMGMSADWVAAVRAGATIVRIGEGIFGKRSG